MLAESLDEHKRLVVEKQKQTELLDKHIKRMNISEELGKYVSTFDEKINLLIRIAQKHTKTSSFLAFDTTCKKICFHKFKLSRFYL